MGGPPLRQNRPPRGEKSVLTDKVIIIGAAAFWDRLLTKERSSRVINSVKLCLRSDLKWKISR